MRPEIDSRDSDCLIVETQLETQACDEPNLNGTAGSPAYVKNMTVAGIHHEYTCSHQCCGCPVSESDLSEGRTMCMNCSVQRDCEHCASGRSFCDWGDGDHSTRMMNSVSTHHPRLVSYAVRNWSRLVYSILLMWLDLTSAVPSETRKFSSSVSWADPLSTVCPQTVQDVDNKSDFQEDMSMETSQTHMSPQA